MKLNKELSKGSHGLILLKLLSSRDMYGYELIQEMERRSEGVFAMSQGSLYPLLHTLESRGEISSYLQSDSGRERRFYHLTDTGRAVLVAQEQEWARYIRAMGLILEGGPT